MSILTPRHQSQVDFDSYAKTKSFSTPTKTKSIQIPELNPVKFDPPNKNQIDFDPITEFTSTSMPTLYEADFEAPKQKPRYFNPYARNKSFSTATQNQAVSNLYTEMTSIPIPHTEIKSMSPTFTKTKSISMLALKPSDIRPVYKNKSISSIYTKQSQLISTLKTNNFRPADKTKSPSIPTLDAKSISINTLKPRNFQPAHKNEVDFFLPPYKTQVNFDGP